MANQSDSRLLRLSEESLTREPEDVFTLHDKIGEGAYGAVYKAVHKESGQLLAIKQVPVDSDLQEIIKEISIMQQCDRWGRRREPHACCSCCVWFRDTFEG